MRAEFFEIEEDEDFFESDENSSDSDFSYNDETSKAAESIQPYMFEPEEER